MREAYARLDLQNDPELNEYVRQLGLRLSRNAPNGDSFHFFIVNNATINAFAVPGGFVGVHSGLLMAARRESELAAVLAHETAHVSQRHIPRLISAGQRITGPTLAAMLAGILIAASGQPAGAAAIAFATAGAAQAQINFTRAFEQEADRIGMSFLDSAGYDAHAMPAFFERMDTLNRAQESNLPEFLRTHPITANRISESLNHAESYPHRTAPDQSDFLHMQARARALTVSGTNAVRFFSSSRAGKNTPEDMASLYGLSISELQQRNRDRARVGADELLKRRPTYLPYQLLRADIDRDAGNIGASLPRYAEAMRRHPASTAAALKYSETLLQAKQPEKAREILDAIIRKNPTEPRYYRILAQAAGEAGRPVDAHRAFGEYYFRIGQPRAAIEQMELARRYAGDSFYYRSSLDARIREIRDQSGLIFKNEKKSNETGRKSRRQK